MMDLTEYITNLNKKTPEPEAMDLDKAFDLVLEHARSSYAQLKLLPKPQYFDDEQSWQDWLSEYKTAINVVDKHWMNMS